MWLDTYPCSATFPQCQNNPSRQQRAERCPQVYSETQSININNIALTSIHFDKIKLRCVTTPQCVTQTTVLKKCWFLMPEIQMGDRNQHKVSSAFIVAWHRSL